MPTGRMFSKVEKFAEIAGMCCGAGRWIYDNSRAGRPFVQGARGMASRAFNTLYEVVHHPIVDAGEYVASLTDMRMGLVFSFS